LWLGNGVSTDPNAPRPVAKSDDRFTPESGDARRPFLICQFCKTLFFSRLCLLCHAITMVSELKHLGACGRILERLSLLQEIFRERAVVCDPTLLLTTQR
jgi:hypothetical protein